MLTILLQRFRGTGPRLYRASAEQMIAYLRAIGYGQERRTGKAMAR